MRGPPSASQALPRGQPSRRPRRPPGWGHGPLLGTHPVTPWHCPPSALILPLGVGQNKSPTLAPFHVRDGVALNALVQGGGCDGRVVRDHPCRLYHLKLYVCVFQEQVLISEVWEIRFHAPN